MFQKTTEELLVEVLERQIRLETKIDRLISKETTNIGGDDVDTDLHIKLMSSSRESVRSQTNYKQCLLALGLPVSTTPEDVSTVIISD